MGKVFHNIHDILNHGFDDIIDVRSPAEFAEDHVPGAISLPALSDAERARIGTIYVQDTPFNARKIGGALVAQNAARHLQGPLADKDGSWRPLIYCWRGGQRSGSFASILTQVGWRAEKIEGGYRAYRRLVVQAVRNEPLPHKLILLEGNTGTAKTELLEVLRLKGVQVIDLEGLANHRGSVFGGRSDPQPSQKAFEGALARVLCELDPARPVVVEAESSKVGQLQVPSSVWLAMRSAPRILIEAPIEARAEYLVRAYSDILDDKARLKETIGGLHYLQGNEVVERWQQMADTGNLKTLASELMQLHYDPRYLKSRERGDVTRLGVITPSSLAPAGLKLAATEIAALVLGHKS